MFKPILKKQLRPNYFFENSYFTWNINNKELFMKNQERYSLCTKIILEIHFDFPVNVNNIITNKGERTNLRHLVKSGFEKLPLRKNCFNILFYFSSSLSLSFLSFLPAFDASVFISPIRTYSFGFVELFCPKKSDGRGLPSGSINAPGACPTRPVFKHSFSGSQIQWQTADAAARSGRSART